MYIETKTATNPTQPANNVHVNTCLNLTDEFSLSLSLRPFLFREGNSSFMIIFQDKKALCLTSGAISFSLLLPGSLLELHLSEMHDGRCALVHAQLLLLCETQHVKGDLTKREQFCNELQSQHTEGTIRRDNFKKKKSGMLKLR